ncbi:N amino acid transport system protein [Penicillium rolfsii]|nr:N amino acid transport system protein [Penicillium rolfsii]
MSKSKSLDQSLGVVPLPVEAAEVACGVSANIQHDAVFGNITEDGPNYRNVGWLGTSILMIKTQIGVIILIIIGGITTWSNYMVGVFKMNHREIYGIDDVGELLFGRIGREFLGAAFTLFPTFCAGSGMLSVSIALNALSMHAICTAVFVAIAAIVTFFFSSIRTLGRISWLAWIGAICIIIAVFTVTIAVGLQDRPSAAPQEGLWKSDYKLFNKPSFSDAASAISALVFSYAGTPAFFSIASEMRDPRHFTKALVVCQTVVSTAYIVVGIVVYYYCGSYVSSPALGSAGPVVKKAAYGIALPGLFVTAILLTHIPSKYVFLRILRGSSHLNSNSAIHWMTWLGCTFGVTLTAFIVASAIPIFGGLVSLVGALLGTVLCFQPMGFMWLCDNWTKGKQVPTLKWRLTVVWCIFVIVSGTFLVVAGTYGLVDGIIASYRADGGTAAWSCADNSGST